MQVRLEAVLGRKLCVAFTNDDDGAALARMLRARGPFDVVIADDAVSDGEAELEIDPGEPGLEIDVEAPASDGAAPSGRVVVRRRRSRRGADPA